MNKNHKNIIVDEIDILNSKKFMGMLSTNVILKKMINLNDFNDIKQFLEYLLIENPTLLKKFLEQYSNFKNCVHKS